MLRVHGDKVIRRRRNYTKQINIQKYTEILKEDFQNICGYCGKDMDKIPCPYQKDHLIPVDAAKEHNRKDLEISYENLVYSCRVCNRNKWNKWPLDNVDCLNNGVVGFADPASEEFDNHLGRNEKGEIIAKSEVGQYMYSVFNFENRLTEVWWKISEIDKLLVEIDERIENNLTIENLAEYRNLHKKCKSFIEELKKQNEMI